MTSKSPELVSGARYAAKIVPKTSPNADGEWIEVTGPELVEGMTNVEFLAALNAQVPSTHFAVQFKRVHQ